MGGSHISTQILWTRTAANARAAWIATIAIPPMLLAPTRWHEGYQVLMAMSRVLIAAMRRIIGEDARPLIAGATGSR